MTNKEKLLCSIESGDVRIILQDLPSSCRGFVYHDAEDRKYIVLNSRATREQNMITTLHEANHIFSGELDDPNYMEYTG